MARITTPNRPPSARVPGDRDPATVLLLGLLLVAATSVVVYRDVRMDFRLTQRQFREMVLRRFGADAARTVPAGVQQIFVPGLDRADRCVTCHQATSWKGFEGAPQPWSTHPPAILTAHPVDRFGCTICHGGRGWAVDEAGAHGRGENWGEPLLDGALAERLSPGLTRRTLMQTACNQCHRYETRTEGAESVNRAKQLVQEKGCRACHQVNGRGGVIGPDLTWAGDKHPAQYEYARLSGRPSVFGWHIAHFGDPRALVPDSVMPNFHLSSDDTQALAVLVMSWRKLTVSADLLGGTPRFDPPDERARAEQAEMQKGPGAWFVRTGCFQCHNVAVRGVRSPTPIGPDLSTAADDTLRRFNLTIDAFIHQPVGTMRAIFSRQIILTPVQKDDAVRELRAVWAEYEAQRAKGPRQ